MMESITEFIYPTDYEPPQLPNPVPAPGSKEEQNQWMRNRFAFIFPSMFNTRNTGETLDVWADPVLAEKHTWDVTLTTELVRLAGFKSYGPESIFIRMPVFSSCRAGGLTRLKEGEWHLLSTQLSPLKLDDTRTNRQRVTLVRIDPATTDP